MKKSVMRKVIAESNTKILKFAEEVSKAIEEEIEEVLEAAEETVKDAVPEVQWDEAFDMLEKALEEEGIEAEFNPKEDDKEASVVVNKIAARIKKASDEEKLEKEELEEIITDVVEAIVDEVEEILKDAEEFMDTEASTFNINEKIAGNKAKMITEKNLSAIGVYSRFQKHTLKK